jgi:predicted amidohydrolase
MKKRGIALWVSILLGGVCLAAAGEWSSGAPRDEIKPRFSRTSSGHLVIEHDARTGLHGYWRREFPVTGGRHYEFRAWRRVAGVADPQRSAFVTILWLDDKDKRVLDDRPLVTRYLRKFTPWTPLEYPTEREAAGGWAEFAAVYQAPGNARKAVVDLHLLWAPRGRVEWRDISLREAQAPQGRKVRLAAVHFRPVGGKTPEGNRLLFAPLIEKAAAQRADLVVLGETLTYYGLGRKPAETAEPVPGPSTEFFGELARKHNLYIVAGIFERDRHLVFNTAILMGPDGKLVGKYRKVTLPDNEWNQGVAPGSDYPVFQTRFGKVGMMICYDGFFPEVARRLTLRGAEVIAWPVWGCNPDLARARAAENHVYLVSSTYEDTSSEWMLTAVWDQTGDTVARAREWGEVAIAEVDLDAQTRWPSLGEFKAKIIRHAPR